MHIICCKFVVDKASVNVIDRVHLPARIKGMLHLENLFEGTVENARKKYSLLD